MFRGKGSLLCVLGHRSQLGFHVLSASAGDIIRLALHLFSSFHVPRRAGVGDYFKIGEEQELGAPRPYFHPLVCHLHKI
jgi:hypothetical protein